MKIFGWKSRPLTREERFGLSISVTTHLVLIVIFLMIYSTSKEQDRFAYIEVTLGDFRDGAPAQYAEQREPDVATRRNPQPRPVTNPRPEPQPETRPETRTEELVKPVEAPKQTEPVQTETTIQTPETDRIDPRETEPDPQREQPRDPDPVQQRDETERQGSLLSGDPRGLRGDTNADQGTTNDPVRSAPYQLEWEGDISRQPHINPLPNYTVDVEAVITVRFSVRPDGTVGRVQPLRRTDPDLENEVIRTLRTWRFNRLPSGAPQVEQFGVITFRFVLD